MQQRTFGRIGLTVPEIGLGCWQLGGGWGNAWDDGIAQQTLQTAFEAGVRFIDTADVYGDGASERSIGRFLQGHRNDGLVLATKLGRAGIYPVPADWDNAVLEAKLYPPTAPSGVIRPLPDWPLVHRELGRKGVTLDLLWQEPFTCRSRFFHTVDLKRTVFCSMTGWRACHRISRWVSCKQGRAAITQVGLQRNDCRR